jgi:CheY-like chemotaxis protein
MSRILLADDSPHAQRMGERILREEGFEVVTVTDGDTAVVRLNDAEPDIVLADAYLPGRSGFDLCRLVKSDPRFRFTRVVLTAGLLEPFDEEEARRAGCDAVLKKPFEASMVIETLNPLIEAALFARGLFGDPAKPPAVEPPLPAPPAPAPPEIDPERVRAAITIALDRALPGRNHRAGADRAGTLISWYDFRHRHAEAPPHAFRALRRPGRHFPDRGRVSDAGFL